MKRTVIKRYRFKINQEKKNRFKVIIHIIISHSLINKKMKSRHNPVGMVHKHYYVNKQIQNLDGETKKTEWAVNQ